MIKCPTCKKEMTGEIKRNDSADFEDVEYQCPEEHLFFIRVRAEDLIDEND